MRHRPEKRSPRLHHPGGGTNPSKPILDKLDQLPEYRGNFLSAQEALVAADSRSLVVVVDTNRPEQTQAPDC